jgi:hypothetical protein
MKIEIDTKTDSRKEILAAVKILMSYLGTDESRINGIVSSNDSYNRTDDSVHRQQIRNLFEEGVETPVNANSSAQSLSSEPVSLAGFFSSEDQKFPVDNPLPLKKEKKERIQIIPY